MTADERLDRLEAATLELEDRVRTMLGVQGWRSRRALDELRSMVSTPAPSDPEPVRHG